MKTARRSPMRLRFTQAELKLARRFADHLAKEMKNARNHPGWSMEDEYRKGIRRVAKELGITGKLKSGAYRVAFVTDKLVFKVQYFGGATRLKTEAKFIDRMKASEHARHFPLTKVITARTAKFTILVQERINFNVRTSWNLQDAAVDLGEHLGIDDVHSANYGWAGPKGKEWPVYVDVDLRLGGRRRSQPARRSWMV